MELTVAQLNEDHLNSITQADQTVSEAAGTVSKDPAHPIYHVTPAARFMNDPNGPVWHKGRYHLFFQHLPYWGVHQDNCPAWGHVSSSDMVHWRHEPIALMPGPHQYDIAGVASGCCVIHNGVPTIIYTGVGPGGQTQCLATSDDEMKIWTKHPGNPVIAHRPDIAGLGDGFRDPCIWKEPDGYRILIGSGFTDKNGTVLLYKSRDLRVWEFLGPMCDGMGEHCFQWECPAFFSLTNRTRQQKHVLIVSPLFSNIAALRGEVQYAVGRYENNRFKPESWQTVDYGGPTNYYAPSSFEDPKGRRILWGWILADRPMESKWSHAMSLPRVISLGDDDKLSFEPVSGIRNLRKHETAVSDIKLQDAEVVIIPRVGLNIEVELRCKLPESSELELHLSRSSDGCRYLPVKISSIDKSVEFNGSHAPIALNRNREVTLRLFIDGCIGELYIDNTGCISAHIPVDVEATGVSAVLHGGAVIKHIKVWEMGSIW
ncbi:MAG: glycoside hydrolase family 32 protein [Armatimonadota bacterium]